MDVGFRFEGHSWVPGIAWPLHWLRFGFMGVWHGSVVVRDNTLLSAIAHPCAPWSTPHVPSGQPVTMPPSLNTQHNPTLPTRPNTAQHGRKRPTQHDAPRRNRTPGSLAPCFTHAARSHKLLLLPRALRILRILTVVASLTETPAQSVSQSLAGLRVMNSPVWCIPPPGWTCRPRRT